MIRRMIFLPPNCNLTEGGLDLDNRATERNQNFQRLTYCSRMVFSTVERGGGQGKNVPFASAVHRGGKALYITAMPRC